MIARGVLLTAAMILAASCSNAGGTDTAIPSPGERLASASQGLCDALGFADQGDVTGAAREFQDRVHEYLHDLADRLSTSDRQAAGDLLEAKQRLEEALGREPSDPSRVRDLIAELQTELGIAAGAAGLPRPTCTEDASS
ncbi:MAG: hypothetical protein M3135_08525 [Actinomycetota bacterium]|nr:hypothetical protein [Actinomycetota bacterium]